MLEIRNTSTTKTLTWHACKYKVLHQKYILNIFFLNSKTLILKDNSIRSIWTYLTASPWCITNTNKHDYTTNTYISTNKQYINAVAQNSYIYAEASNYLSFMDIHIVYNTQFRQKCDSNKSVRGRGANREQSGLHRIGKRVLGDIASQFRERAAT